MSGSLSINSVRYSITTRVRGGRPRVARRALFRAKKGGLWQSDASRRPDAGSALATPPVYSGAASAKRLRRMVRLPVIAAALILPGLALAQPADDAAKCQAAAGSYLTGTVVSGPHFKPGAPLHGTYLSHTHLTLRGDADGRAY